MWAATAGLAPVLGGVVALAGAVVGTTVVHTTVTDPGPLSPLGAGTLGDLGLAGGSQVLGAPLAGVLSAWVLAAGARRRREPALAFLSMASIVVGLVASALAADLSGGGWAVGLAATFLVAEVLALGLRHDPFWARLLAAVGAAAEVAAGAVTALIVQAAVYSADWGSTSVLGQGQERVVALSFTLAFLAWIAADLRRYRGTPRPAGVALLRAEAGRWGRPPPPPPPSWR